MKRKDHFKCNTECNYNPLFNYRSSQNVPHLNTNVACRILEDLDSPDNFQDSSLPDVQFSSLHSSESFNADCNQSVYDYSNDDDDNGDFNSTEKYYMSNITSVVSTKFIRAVINFKENSSTMLGGSKSVSSISMDVTNIFKVLDSIGEVGFWAAKTLQDHLTKEFESGKSPTTVHARIRSILRFLEYLQLYDPNLIPKSCQVARLEKILKICEKSLLRSRNNRRKNIMAGNRRKYDHTIEVLKQWREKRSDAKALSLFDKFDKENFCLLTHDDYISMRNFLLCELIIPNGQRSGIIPGLIIEEIEQSQEKISPEGYHRIMISEHKTGTNQCATLFVYPNIFRALKILRIPYCPAYPFFYVILRILTINAMFSYLILAMRYLVPWCLQY